MAVAFRSVSTKSFLATSTVTLDKPSGVADGDLLLAAIYTDPQTRSVNSAPSGWTSLTGSQLAISNDAGAECYWKIASSEGASWNWGYSGAVDGAGIVLAYS